MKKLILFVIINCSLPSADCFSQWIQQNSGTTGDLNSVYFVNPLTGWVCGVTGNNSTDRIAKSSNGGITWVRQDAGTSYVLNSIRFINNQTGWAVGIHGAVMKSTNSGNNWVISPVVFLDMNVVNFVDLQTGWVGGIQVSGLYQTTNGGSNWSYLYFNTAFRSIDFVNSTTGFGVSGGANIYKTTNGGINWSSTLFANESFTSIFMLDSILGWAVGGFSRQAITTNGGISWDTSKISLNSIGPNSVFFVNRNIGYIVGYNGIIYKTISGGINWNMQTSNTLNNLKEVFFIDSLNGWIAGEGGIILKTTNGGGTVGVNFISTEMPKSFSISQNYPNPFNPTTNIEFALAKNSAVKLIIFDITGREVQTLVNGELRAGTYKADFDGTNFASGMYFYTLTTNEFTETKKMVLIK